MKWLDLGCFLGELIVAKNRSEYFLLFSEYLVFYMYTLMKFDF